MVKMKASLLGYLAITASSAFVHGPNPSSYGGRRRGFLISMSVNDMVGIDVETGGLFDPIGFSKDEASLFRYRAAELKHGRVAMLAVIGSIVPSFYHLPDPIFSSPRPLGALKQILAERPLALLQILLALGALDLTIGRQDYENKAAGELGSFGAPFKPQDEDEFEDLQLKELKNGRLAMVASLGLLAQEAVTGQGPVEQILSGHILPFGQGIF